ncbi:hypothetical protein U1Q18_048243 [Sarracenia purpurea var. burkii]
MRMQINSVYYVRLLSICVNNTMRLNQPMQQYKSTYTEQNLRAAKDGTASSGTVTPDEVYDRIGWRWVRLGNTLIHYANTFRTIGIYGVSSRPPLS